MNDFVEPGSLALAKLYQGKSGAAIRGKKVVLSISSKVLGGVTVTKTNQTLTIGIYDELMTSGQCNMIFERHGDYLIGQGL
ncbi:hypothetical protein V6N13_049268 [Hibiscus sabdariffa]|uniref:Profilin n=1 Tax=Hibiscus sabdariffa TaxID=183260 RepID=A0ABR2QXZ1_9ROSI